MSERRTERQRTSLRDRLKELSQENSDRKLWDKLIEQGMEPETRDATERFHDRNLQIRRQAAKNAGLVDAQGNPLIK